MKTLIVPVIERVFEDLPGLGVDADFVERRSDLLLRDAPEIKVVLYQNANDTRDVFSFERVLLSHEGQKRIA